MQSKHVLAGMIVMLVGGSTGLGQLLPTVPEATPKSPDYTPPPPAPVTPPAPAAPTPPPVATPDLVKKDADGKVIVLTVPTEEAALAMIKLDPSQESKVMQVRMERRARMDALIAQHPGDALELRRVVMMLDEVTDLTLLVRSRTMMNSVMVSKSLSEMLSSAGAITPQQQKAVSEAATAYGKALNDEAMAKVKGKGDLNLSGLTIAKANIPRSTREFMRDFNRMLVALANRWGEVSPMLGEVAKGAEAEIKAVSAAKDDAGRADAMAAVLRKLDEPTQKKLLAMVASPTPENPIVPPDAPKAPAPTKTTIEQVPAPDFKPQPKK